MKRWLGAGAAIALLVGAWFVARATPDGEARLSDPFPVTAAVGSAVEGRNIGVRVNELTLADRITAGGWFAEGTWLVVDLDAWAVRTESPAALQMTTLVIGDTTYTASERPDFTVSGSTLRDAGLFLDHPRTGAVVFELPSTIGTAHGTLRLALFTDVADSVIELPVDFSSVAHADELALPEPDWATP